MKPLQIQCIFTKVDLGPNPSFILRAVHECIFTKVDFGLNSFCIIVLIKGHLCIFTKVDSGWISCFVLCSDAWVG